jgi:spore maturation protein CgeB
MTAWAKNLQVLERINPRLARLIAEVKVPEDHRLVLSRQGAPSLQVGRRRLHSSYDPVREGQEWCRCQSLEGSGAVVIFGLGLGYHILPLLQDKRTVYLVEPSAAVARLALSTQDLTPLLAHNGLRVGRDFRDLPRPARLLAYGPSRRMAPDLFTRLAKFLAGEPEKEGYLRILVVSPLYGGSHPIARYTYRGFKELGHEARLLDFAPFYPTHQALPQVTQDKVSFNNLSREWLRFLGEVLLSKVRDFHPDLVFCLAQAPVDPALVEALKAEGVLVAYWFVEDFQVFPYWRDLAPAMDVFFTLQKEPFSQELRQAGARHPAFLPLAADPEIYRPLPVTVDEQQYYGADLSFVGAGYRNRQEFFQGFLDLDFKIWGSDWNLKSPVGDLVQNQGSRVSEEEAVRIFNASRINLNLHSSPFHPGINPDGDYLNPRVFDLAATGAFQLVDRRSQLPEFFQPEVELSTFSHLTEAREKIGYFLAHEEERRSISARGRERCLRDHTYARRMQEALDLIEDMHPGVLSWQPTALNPGLRLSGQFPPDHPVQAVLAHASREITGLGDLVEHLKSGEAPLSEPEAILWLVHEFSQGLQRGRF